MVVAAPKGNFKPVYMTANPLVVSLNLETTDDLETTDVSKL